MLADLCDKVDASNLGPNINLINGYIEGRLVLLRNASVGAAARAWTMMVLLLTKS